MGINGFLLQWCGAWALAALAGRWSRDRRWRIRWRRAARGVAPAAAIGAAVFVVRTAAGGLVRVPGPPAAAVWLAGAVAALGFATLWEAGRLEGRGRRRTVLPLAWLGGLLAMGGCLAAALAGLGTGRPLWSVAALLLVGGAGLLAGLSRKPRPTGTWAAGAYVAVALATAFFPGGW